MVMGEGSGADAEASLAVVSVAVAVVVYFVVFWTGTPTRTNDAVGTLAQDHPILFTM